MADSHPSRASRPFHRGGIRKSRQSTPQRTDRDGDTDMTRGSQRGRGNPDRNSRGHRGNQSQRGSGNRGTGRLYQPPHLAGRTPRSNHHGPISINALEKAIDNGDIDMANYNAGAGNLAKITVSGFRQNAKEMDGKWLNTFADWLRTKAGQIRVEKPRKNDKGIVTVFVQPEDNNKVMALEGFSYKGGSLHFKAYPRDPAGHHDQNQQHQQETRSQVNSSTTRDHLEGFLNSKWNRVEKTLDLSHLIGESALQIIGVFGSESTRHKFFPALMKVCDSIWRSPRYRAEVVTGISLANNAVSNVTVFSSLAPTFPQLKRLSLSNNSLSNIESISPWRWKFRELEELDISQNALTEIPDIRETMKRWYPNLRQLNLDGRWEQVRSVADLTAARNPIPVLGASFQDEADIGGRFVTEFFRLIDRNRSEVIRRFYDDNSTFSLSVNTKRPQNASENFDTKMSRSFIQGSRNLLIITHPPARTARLFTGARDIERFWGTLPDTNHCDPHKEANQFMIECHSLPGVPDPSNEIPGGVSGLIIMISSVFEEENRASGEAVRTWSFHRTFVLGPGTSDAGIRVVSDILNLRPDPAEYRYKGGAKLFERLAPWNLDQLGYSHPEAPADFGNAGSGKSVEQYQKERMVLEFSFDTKLTLAKSEECLAANAWNLHDAKANYIDLQANNMIPDEWYCQQLLNNQHFP